MQTSWRILVDVVLFLSGSIIVSLLVLWLVRRVVPHEKLTPHNDVSGFVYAAIGVIYAVLLGFAVISVWEEARDAEENALQEANAVRDLYRLAGGLPSQTGEEVRAAALAYATTVVDVEWDAMDDQTAPSPEAIAQLDRLWQALTQANPTTETETVVLGESLSQLDQLSGHRAQRIIDSDSGIVGLLWVVLIGGAALTVLFPAIFGVENAVLHALIIATLAATLGLLLLLTFDLNHPYRGDVDLSPEGFQRVIDQFADPSTAVIR